MKSKMNGPILKSLIYALLVLVIAGCSNSPSDGIQPTTHLIQYEVTGTADDIAYIQYYGEKYSSDYEFDRNVTLPWYYSFNASSGKYLKFLVHTYSANVSITAKIIIDGNIAQIEDVYLDYPHAFVTVDAWVP
ncbi:MAG: MmpS family transport accessory protein [Dehalococcoidia bacterium]